MEEENCSKYCDEEIYEYLCHGIYPAGVDKQYKHGLRKRSKFFVCNEGQLYYSGGKRRTNNLRLVIQQDREKERIISSVHDQAHLGRDKTVTAIKSRYYWRSLYNDVSRHVS